MRFWAFILLFALVLAPCARLTHAHASSAQDAELSRSIASPLSGDSGQHDCPGHSDQVKEACEVACQNVATSRSGEAPSIAIIHAEPAPWPYLASAPPAELDVKPPRERHMTSPDQVTGYADTFARTGRLHL